MICRHRAALGGLQLDEIDPAIVIQRIEEPEPKEQIQTALIAGGANPNAKDKDGSTALTLAAPPMTMNITIMPEMVWESGAPAKMSSWNGAGLFCA